MSIDDGSGISTDWRFPIWGALYTHMGRWEEVVVAALNHAYDEAKALGGKGGRGGKSGAGSSSSSAAASKQTAAANFLLSIVKCVSYFF